MVGAALVAASWLSLPASDGSAQAAPSPQTLSVTVSGGASLGAYEGGYLYYLAETLSRNPTRFRLRIVTGASAGSTNSLLLALASCRPSVARPEDSPFYGTWTRSTFDALFVPAQVGPLGMFSRDVISAIWDEQATAFEAGLPEDCEFVLGVPATRLEAFEIPLRGELGGLARSEERFMVRVTGRGAGRVPSVENYIDRVNAYAPAFLPVDGEGAHEFSALRDLIFASSAFPLAFAPYPVPHCIGDDETQNQTPCTPEAAVSARFVDGGVFDNAPLRLATTIARTGLVRDADVREGLTFRDAPDITERELPRRTLFLHVDPALAAYPFEPPADDDSAGEGALLTALRLTGNVLAGGQERELTGLLEDYPEIRERVRVSHAYLPQTGSLMYGFLALFDEQFLAFDFVLGMLDAQRMVETGLSASARAHAGDESVALVHPEADRASLTWRAYECVRAVLDAVGSPEALCAGDDLAPTRALLQLAIERLYLRCSTLAEGTRTTHAHCQRAIAGEAPPRVPHLPAAARGEDPARGEGEAAVAHAVRRLDELGFHFRGLGLAPDEGSRAMLAIRERLSDIGGRFVDEQPSTRQTFDALLRYTMNTIAYAPPMFIGHVTVGRHIELGASLGSPFGHVRWLRATGALSILGFESAIAAGPTRMAFGLSLGVELEPLRLNRALYQLRFGARAGFALGTRDDAGRSPCVDNENARLCTRAFVDTYVSIAIAELIRLQVSAFFYPGYGDDLRFTWFVGPSLGVQFRSRM
jgi:hypothetical protein